MNLLVLGGSRFVGKHIVLQALERGHSVTTFTRGRTPDDLPAAVRRLHGDRNEGLTIPGDERWDACIDVSGYLPRAVRASAEALRDRVGRYLFISTVSVYAPGERAVTTEDSPVIELDDPTSEDIQAHYGGLKVLCERAVDAIYGERATHVRPHVVAGPDDPTERFTYWPEALAAGGPVLAPGDGQDPVQYVDARDLGAFVVTLLEQDRGGAYNGVAASRPWRAFLAEVAEGVGATPDLRWTPAEELERRGLGWAELPLYVPQAQDDTALMRVDTARSQAAGLRERPLAETAADTLAWSRARPADQRPKPVPLDAGSA
ncbi:NAD-dependent epimerase/dehydratase family protein [Deinococcus sonorensis]|uniref:NAD-dependent epimerase/dehydratase family protein n=2 Tax=Deinococcus sonorensis TaxID=309891 RepID=A0AAU7U9P7_9DEIO